jgi:hypothetical protein
LILELLNTPDAKVYAYDFNGMIYPAVAQSVNQKTWLIMMSMDGVLETAFPPDRCAGGILEQSKLYRYGAIGITIMNALLQRYLIDTEFPEVSGAEHLEMLQVRDRLLALEPTLSSEEKEQLTQGDRHLIHHAPQVLQELSQFVDLAVQRRIQEISAERWWWYLDVLTQMMTVLDKASNSSPV